eukprot:SAG31_NODE_526_length_14475_cov_5.135197_14_plen_1106_part_00
MALSANPQLQPPVQRAATGATGVTPSRSSDQAATGVTPSRSSDDTAPPSEMAKLDAHSLPAWKPTRTFVDENRSALAWAFSVSIAEEERLLAKRIGYSKVSGAAQSAYTMFHLCQHHVAGTAENGFRRAQLRKFAIRSPTKSLLLQLVDVRACPKDYPLPLKLPQEHFLSRGIRGGQGGLLLGPIPLLCVRFLCYDLQMYEAGKLPAVKQRAIAGFFEDPNALGGARDFAMIIKAESAEELEYTNARLIENQGYMQPPRDHAQHFAGFEESVLYPIDSRVLHAVEPIDRPLPRPSILFKPIEERVTLAGFKFQTYLLSPLAPAPGTEVIVKVQPPAGHGPWLYYDGGDESSTANVQTLRGMIPADATGIENARALIQRHGIRQHTAQGDVAYKAFLRARAEGDCVRLFLDVFEDGFLVVEPADEPVDAVESERRDLVQLLVSQYGYDQHNAASDVTHMRPADVLRELQLTGGGSRPALSQRTDEDTSGTQTVQARSRAAAADTTPCRSAAAAVPAENSSKFSVADRVEVIGLQKSPEHNGMNGIVTRWHSAKERWGVELSNGSVLRIRPQNLRPYNPSSAPDVCVQFSEVSVVDSLLSMMNAPATDEIYTVLMEAYTLAVNAEARLGLGRDGQSIRTGQLRLRAGASGGLALFQYLWARICDDTELDLMCEPSLDDPHLSRAEAATYYFTQAAEAGHAYAMCKLGSMASDRQDPRSSEEAKSWWRKALATAAVPEAAYNLGMCYGLGENDTLLDLDIAYAYYSGAARIDLSAHSCASGTRQEQVVANCLLGSWDPALEGTPSTAPTGEPPEVYVKHARTNARAVWRDLKKRAADAETWDRRDCVAEYFAGNPLGMIAINVDGEPPDSPYATGERAQRFIVQYADRRGLIIDVHTIRRNAVTGLPILQGFFGHNDMSDPAFTRAIASFMVTQCGPGMEYGTQGYELQGAEFDELHSCLVAATVTGARAVHRREAAESKDWGYVYPPAFQPFELEGRLPAGLVPSGKKRNLGRPSPKEQGNPHHEPGWRLRKAIKAERQNKVLRSGFSAAPELFRQAIAMQRSDPDEAFALAFEASTVDSPIGEDNPWLCFVDDAERERCEAFTLVP